MRGMVTRYIGRCGVCERDYKLLAGRLVHHGYRRPGHGYIVGDCFGVGYEPYESSVAACSAYRESCERTRDGLFSRLDRLLAGEVHEITVYKIVREGFGQKREVPEVLRRDSGDRYRFEQALGREISDTRRRAAFFDEEIGRMSRLITAWVRRPLRTVEEFEREAGSAVAEKRSAREAERAERRRVKAERRSSLDTKRGGWEAEKQALIDGYRGVFMRFAAESPPDRLGARAAWIEMHRAKARKGYLHFYPRALDADDALIALGLAQVVDRTGGPYTEYASSYGFGITPNSAITPNGGYYVWVLDERGEPLLEGPYGPHELEQAKALARIGATEGEHNRAVSRGRTPTEKSFEVVREYEAGTGERLV